MSHFRLLPYLLQSGSVYAVKWIVPNIADAVNIFGVMLHFSECFHWITVETFFLICNVFHLVTGVELR